MLTRVLTFLFTLLSLYNLAQKQHHLPDDIRHGDYACPQIIKHFHDSTHTLIAFQKTSQELALFYPQEDDSVIKFHKDTSGTLQHIIPEDKSLTDFTPIKTDTSTLLFLDYKQGQTDWWVITDSTKEKTDISFSSQQHDFTGTNITFADLNGNGKSEALKIHSNGHYYLYKYKNRKYNGGSDFHHGPDSPFFGMLSPDACAIDFFDLDRDGDQDLIISKCNGEITVMENTGSPKKPSFTNRTRFNRMMSNVQYEIKPICMELANFNDNDQCTVLLSDNHQTLVFQITCK